MDLLKEMYHGRVSSFAEIRIRTPEYEKAVKRMIETEEKLVETYPEIKELFEDLKSRSFLKSIVLQWVKSQILQNMNVLLLIFVN